MPPEHITANARILVIGGYGVFGARLARRLARHADIETIVAGRSLAKAEAHCARFGGRAAVIDTNGDLATAFAEWRPTVVVDAAGPFQLYGEDPYRVARAALAADADYLDLADDAAFVAGVEALDTAARAANRAAIAGCSSVPAISAAAVTALAQDLAHIDAISSVILPGNRAPRGRSVVRAILAQVGRPIRVMRAGTWQTVRGWTTVHRLRPAIAGVAPLRPRHASPIGAPDLELFPRHFKARTVRFHAGLELGVMHLGLAAIARMVARDLLSSATPLTGVLLWLADRLKPFGSDRGAMTVDVLGRTDDGIAEHRRWTLIAEAGDGPEIPSTPAYLLALRLARAASTVPPGARACLTDLTLEDIEAGLADYAITTHRTAEPITPLFETALAEDFAALPAALRDLHDVLDTRLFEGRASVERGTGVLSRLLARVMGFPPASADVAVSVEMVRGSAGETWQRRFGASRFRSTLSRRAGAGRGEVWERFGVLSFLIALERDGGDLHYPVRALRVFGVVPLPRFLMPVSETREYVDDAGRACFDVAISHPLAGFIVRYRGWLEAAGDAAAKRHLSRSQEH